MKHTIFSTVGLLAMAVPTALAAGRVCETSPGSPTVYDATWAEAYWVTGAGSKATLVCQTNSGGGCITLGTYTTATLNFCSSQASCKTVQEIENGILDVIDHCRSNDNLKVGGKWVFEDGSHADVFHS
ncbi:hypothetical protein DFP72DRAFT_1044703 [Ephemerocybe angulata]|uniref:Uncharacterized protein n=1 Tax=Ephemerocybe angulata TaxID=980116 RepID=A0A8H6I331_9AGAR|nr:hypothetical protein DFP72DRAFT_1044703 [Tulosesus angulatus]